MIELVITILLLLSVSIVMATHDMPREERPRKNNRSHKLPPTISYKDIQEGKVSIDFKKVRLR